MEGKDTNEVWDWQEHVFRLDVESPLGRRSENFQPFRFTRSLGGALGGSIAFNNVVTGFVGIAAISQSLWDDFSQSETDVGTLFTSTPASEITDTKSSSFIFEQQANVELNSSDRNLHEDSPRLKRRRMLQFPGEQSYSDSFIRGCESFQMHEPCSAGSMWYMGNDELPSSVVDDVEQSAENWMARCFNDRDGQTAQDQMNVGGSMNTMPENHIQERQGGAGQGVQTIISSCRGTMTGRRIRGNIRPTLMAKLATPVAYPFAVVKPSGIQGDVTLKDINQRIMMPPSRPVLPHVTAAASVIIEDEKLSSSSVASSTAPSGKSVVALTKIHTEGKGTITIMRTKN